MKRIKSKYGKGMIFVLLIISPVILIIFTLYVIDRIKIEKARRASIGTYHLNFSETELPANDVFNRNDSLIIKNLKLTLYPDNTFRFSRKIPYLWDSFGVWKVINDPPNMYINYYDHSWKYLLIQGSRCCFNSTQIDLYYRDRGFLIFNKSKK